MEPLRLFVPKGSGRAFVIREGQSFGIVQPEEGQQVVDLNAFRLADPAQHFWASRTGHIWGMHITTGARLISTPPQEEPMLRVTEDTMSARARPGVPRPHDVLFGRCSRKLRRRRYGPEGDTPGCQENLADAIAEFGLDESHVHDAFNVFMQTWIDEDDQFAFVASRARGGDRVTLEAYMDCIVAVATCPGQSSGPDANGIHVEGSLEVD